MGKFSSAFTSIFLVMSTCPKYVVLKFVSSSNLSVLITLAYTPSYTSRYSAFSFSGLPPRFTSVLTNSYSCNSFYRPIFLSVIHLIFIQVMKNLQSIRHDIFDMFTQYGPFFHLSGALFLVVILSFIFSSC